MQESEEKKRVGKHAASSEKTKRQGTIKADTNLYGDETDIPIRPRKQTKKPSSTKKKRKAKSPSKAKKRRVRWDIFARFNASETTYTRKKRAFIEIVHTDGENPHFKSILILGRRISLWPIIVIVVLFATVFMVFMNNSNLNVKEQKVTVVGLPSGLEDYRMLIVSDLNGKRFGDKQSALLRTIGNTDYDAIFFLGDMVGKSNDPEPFYELLDGIPASKEKFFICGDSDPGPYVDVPRDITGTLSQLVLEDWILGAIDRGAVYVDSPISMSIGNSTMWITPSTLMNLEATEFLNTWKEQTEQEEDGVISGLDADYQSLPLTTYRYRIAQNFYNSIDSIKEEDFLLTLSHEVPSDKSIYAMASHESPTEKYLSEPELILAGHYCGGVWRLPVLGAFYVPDNMMARNGWFPDQEDVKGLSTVGESQVFITGGLSTNTETPIMAFRLFNQPELSVLTLTATLPESMLSVQ